jgi:hypothetical protein
MKKASLLLTIFLKTASVVTKESLKSAGTQSNWFPLATGNFMKKSAKNCQLQRLSETFSYEKKQLSGTLL